MALASPSHQQPHAEPRTVAWCDVRGVYLIGAAVPAEPEPVDLETRIRIIARQARQAQFSDAARAWLVLAHNACRAPVRWMPSRSSRPAGGLAQRAAPTS